MIRLRALVLLLCLPSCADEGAPDSSGGLPAGKADIFGEDTRAERFENTQAALTQAFGASVAVVKSADLALQADDTWFAQASTLGQKLRLCPGERFAAQPVLPYCSGTLIGPNIVLTAGHCVTRCSEMMFLFNFAYDAAPSNSEAPFQRITQDNVYYCDRVLRKADEQLSTNNAELDFAIVRLDRDVTVAQPVKLANAVEGEPITTIGHSAGLPQKYATSTVAVRDNVLFTEADTLGGNSGSGVFNQLGELVGLIYGGNGNSFRLNEAETCAVTARCGVNEGSSFPCQAPNRALPLHMIKKELTSAKIEVSALTPPQ